MAKCFLSAWPVVEHYAPLMRFLFYYPMSLRKKIRANKFINLTKFQRNSKAVEK